MKYLFLSFLIGLSGVSVAKEAKLSLKQKKNMGATKAKMQPDVDTIKTACGKEIPYKTDWSKYSGDDSYDAWIVQRSMNAAATAIAKFVKEGFKDEVCNGVKKIVIKKTDAPYKAFKGGVLTLGRKKYSEGFGSDSIYTLIENNL